MRILLIQQDLGRRLNARPIYPIGLVSIASQLTDSHAAKIFDPNLYPFSQAKSKLIATVREFSPDIVGLSIKYIDTTNRFDPHIFYNTVPETLAVIKKMIPQAPLIVGGAGFSIFAETIMRENPLIDYGVHLEAEETFPELIDNLADPRNVKGLFFRKGSRLEFTGRRSLSRSFPTARYDKAPGLLDVGAYITSDYRIFGIQSKRGCAFQCSYCNYPYLNGEEYRLRDPMDVADEIGFFTDRFGLRCFTFADNIFNVPIAHARRICRELTRRRLNVEWGAWCDLHHLSGDLLSDMAEAGCRYIDFSPDASTDESLRALGKGISESDLHQGFRLAKEEKRVTFGFNFFCSHPDMKWKEAFKTITWWIKIPLRLLGRGRVSLSWIRIYPNTRIFKTARDQNPLSGEALFVKSSDLLKNVYYSNPSFKFLERIFALLIYAADRLIKPILGLTFRIAGKKYPFYHG